MLSRLKNMRGSIKRFMDDKIKSYTDMFFNDRNRKILGVIVIGFGVGLFASGYVH